MNIHINTEGRNVKNSKEYTAYKKVISQSLNSTDRFIYKDWITENGFVNFLKDTGLKPKPYARAFFAKKDKSKPYSPDNFEWKLKPIKVLYEKNTPVHILDFTMQKIENPNISCIYKLTFSNGCFYVGSTKNYRIRAGLFKTMFNGCGKLHNKKMILCMAECTSAVFELMELIPDTSQLKTRETEVIKQFIGNPLLINRAFDAHSNKGVRWTEEEKNKTKQVLIEKYRLGIYKPTAYKYRKSAKKPEELFRSKYFGDKD